MCPYLSVPGYRLVQDIMHFVCIRMLCLGSVVMVLPFARLGGVGLLRVCFSGTCWDRHNPPDPWARLDGGHPCERVVCHLGMQTTDARLAFRLVRLPGDMLCGVQTLLGRGWSGDSMTALRRC
jgi:hypothetical protein